MQSAQWRLLFGIILSGLTFISLALAACSLPGGNTTTMTTIQRLTPTSTIGPPQPFIVGRPYSLDGSADGGDLIMISTTEFELIGHAQYAPITGGVFDNVTCGAIKQLPLGHPAGPITVLPGTPLGFETNRYRYAKVAFTPHNGTIAISSVVYPTCD